MMKKLILLLYFLFLALNCQAQQSPKYNLNFETRGKKENLAKGWFEWGKYDLTLDSTITHSGKYSAKISSNNSGSLLGSVAYKIPARYKGKTIKLTGFMKTKNVRNGFAGLLLRVDGTWNSLAFSNMNKRNIHGTRDWEKYSITLHYPQGARKIYVAGILKAKGEAWFDDFNLKIDGKNVQTLKEIPQKLALLDHEFDDGSKINFPQVDKKLVNDLTLLGKMWGFLKYYHPAVAAGKYNWDYELFRILPKNMKNKNTADRNKIFLHWINGLGSVSNCKKCAHVPSDAFLKPKLSWIDDNSMGTELKEKLHDIYKNRSLGKHFYIRMGKVGNPVFQHERRYPKMSYPDPGFRLLALYRYWNMIEYFYPNRNLMDKDWDNILKEYIPKFIHASNELQYELAALQLIAEIDDTHANLWSGADKIANLRGHFYPPFNLRFIQGKLVVTDYYNPGLKEQAGLPIGSIITRINHKKVSAIVDSLNKYYPASNSAARMRDMAEDLLRSNKKHINIEYSTADQNNQTKTLALYKKDSLNYYRWYRIEPHKKSYKMLDGNIGYVTLGSIKKKDVPKIKKAFKNTKGIIIDIRNYPNTFVPFSLGSYFVSSTTAFVKFTDGSSDNPGTFSFTKLLQIPNSTQTYRGKLVVIVNDFTLSQAEYTAMAFRAGDNTTIVGNQTAGADGSVSDIALPGGLVTGISGRGVNYPDGKQTQRVGIVPDIKVKPTIEGIRKGKDELLEKAIEVINKSAQ